MGNSVDILKKLWLGNYSLSKSYWLFGNVVPLIFFIVLIILALFFQEQPIDALINLKLAPAKLYQKIILLIIMIIFFIYSVISTVGIWRSSNKYERKKYWSVLAKITIFFALFTYIRDIYKFFL